MSKDQALQAAQRYASDVRLLSGERDKAMLRAAAAGATAAEIGAAVGMSRQGVAKFLAKRA